MPALATIEEAVEAAGEAGRSLTGTLRLTLPHSAAELVVLPLATAFIRDHPGVAVELIVEDRLNDIVATGFDAGVRFKESLEQDMIAVPIGPMQRAAVVATPAYFAGHPPPRSPRNLAHVGILRRFSSGRLYLWEFKKDGESMTVAMRGPLVLNDNRLIAQAVLAGAGLAYVFEDTVAQEIADGRLVRVLEDWCPAFAGFYLYYPRRDLMRPMLRAFIAAVRCVVDRLLICLDQPVVVELLDRPRWRDLLGFRGHRAYRRGENAQGSGNDGAIAQLDTPRYDSYYLKHSGEWQWVSR